MSVFNADVITKTLDASLQESTTNHLLLGRGQVSGVASNSFLSAAGVHVGAEQQQTTGDESVFVDGMVTVSTPNNLFDYTYGSLYSMTMGKTFTTVVGKQRGWYRGLPDGDNTQASYYTGVNDFDPNAPLPPGYDPGEGVNIPGQPIVSVLEARSIFNENLAQYQWEGLTEVRLVNDHIQYGTATEPISTTDFQYGDVISRVKGNDNSSRHGNVSVTFQGDRTRTYSSAGHTVVTLGMNTISNVGHESSDATKKRADNAKSIFSQNLANAEGGNTPPASAHISQWSDIYHPATQRMPMAFDIVEGVHLLVNLNADFTIALMRNAMGVIGATGRLFGIDVKAGWAAWKTLLLIPKNLVLGVSAASVRAGELFLGMLRAGPPEPVEAAAAAPQGAAAAAAADLVASGTDITVVGTARAAAVAAARVGGVGTARSAQVASDVAGDAAAEATNSAATAAADEAAAVAAARAAAAAARASNNAARAAEQAAQEAADAAQASTDAARTADEAAQEAEEAAQAAQEVSEAAQAAEGEAAAKAAQAAEAKATKAAAEAAEEAEEAEDAASKASFETANEDPVEDPYEEPEQPYYDALTGTEAEEAAASAQAAAEARATADEAQQEADAAEARAEAAAGKRNTAAEKAGSAQRAAAAARAAQATADADAATARAAQIAAKDAALASRGAAQQAARAATVAAENAAKEAAEAAKLAARQQAVTTAQAVGGVYGSVGALGGVLAGSGSGNHLPDSSLGSGLIGQEGDNSSPGGFEIPS